ncbi:MAG: complex I 24 kDa subunit family protein [Candidatus Aminicenantia bacterium]
MELNKLDEIIERYRFEESGIIGILHEIQEKERYLSEDALKYVCEKLDIPPSQIYHLATFFKAFSLVPKGKHNITVCLGTACHVRGGQKIVENLERELKIKAGQTTKDKLITLETVNCLGCCAIGPIVVMNGEYHGEMDSRKALKIVEDLKEEG